MRLFISVVSHGHSDLIAALDCIPKLNQDFVVVVKNNLECPREIVKLNTLGVKVINERFNSGFGENNNIVFDYCQNELMMSDDDYFLVLNPDVVVDKDVIKDFLSLTASDRLKFSTANLYKDSSFETPDNSIRRFPKAIDFFNSFLGIGKPYHYDKSIMRSQSHVDWAAGSCLLFRADHYKRLNGFDERFFMYCEDIDICRRSHELNEPLTFLPEIKMLHLAEHSNRSIFSKHFFWHVKSIIKYLCTKY